MNEELLKNYTIPRLQPISFCDECEYVQNKDFFFFFFGQQIDVKWTAGVNVEAFSPCLLGPRQETMWWVCKVGQKSDSAAETRGCHLLQEWL